MGISGEHLLQTYLKSNRTSHAKADGCRNTINITRHRVVKSPSEYREISALPNLQEKALLRELLG